MDLTKKQTNLRIDEILHAKLKIIAAKERRSANNMMEYFIAKSIEKYETENGEIILTEDDVEE
ncbi:MAG: toxin-antitoxin system HicB family antitoxin [Oscillospiraceae bacterium]|nr:toxin-antitoxin system HicB family antitoxin [Oscillospiraceae bacterium]